MNLLIIGNDVDSYALDMWKNNTNYIVINKNPNLWSKEFDKYCKNKKVIAVTTTKQFQEKDINSTIDLMLNKKFIPILIADNKESFEVKMYYALEEEIPETVLYIKNEKNKDYKELINLTKQYLLGKGIIRNDRTIRASKERKGPVTQK